MNSEIINAIITIGSGIFCTILGWVLNCLYQNRFNKVKLSFSLQQASGIEDRIVPEFRTKYSESDYCIKVYNTGNTSYILEQISLQYKKKTITDCVIVEENQTIAPYGCYTYQLNEQEYDAILWHCKQADLKSCKVVAYDVAGKKTTGSLDLILPYIQTHQRI